MPWAQDRLGVQKASPSTNGLSVLLTLVTLLACVGIASATTARSRVKNPYFGPAAFTWSGTCASNRLKFFLNISASFPAAAS